MENSTAIPQKIKNEITTSSSNSRGRHIHTQKNWKQSQRDICTLVFIAAFLFTTAKMWKQSKLSINEEMDKQNVAYLYNGVFIHLKRKKILKHVTIWMKLEYSMVSEICNMSVTKDNKYYMILLVWSYHSSQNHIDRK